MTPAHTRRRRARLLALLVVVGAFFVLGIAVGEALHDNPKPGGTQTLIRTLTPLGLAPASASTTTGP